MSLLCIGAQIYFQSRLRDGKKDPIALAIFSEGIVYLRSTVDFLG